MYCGSADGQDSSERFVPGFAAVTRLMGKLHRASGDAKSAVNYQVQALETNPFMWDSFTDLCDTGGLGESLYPGNHGADREQVYNSVCTTCSSHGMDQQRNPSIKNCRRPPRRKSVPETP